MKRLEILPIDNSLVDNTVTHWREGGLVVIPTETVYGLAADATNGEAVARIYALKSRPQFNPLIVHVANVEIAKRYVEWNGLAEKLAAAFWPGPLTLVLRRKDSGSGIQDSVSELVSAGGDTLAVRIPSHPITRQLLAAFDGPIAAPSANRSGRVSPTTAQHVRDEFGDNAPLIIDGGPCDVGLESTVLDLSGAVPVLLRAGAVTRAMVEEVARVESRKSSEAMLGTRHPAPGTSTLKSPGQLAAHYAPSIPVRLNAVEVAADEALLAFGPTPLIGAAMMLNLSARGDLIEAAANLFAHLRVLDKPTHRAIAVMPIPTEGIGEAINDRLQRASIRG